MSSLLRYSCDTILEVSKVGLRLDRIRSATRLDSRARSDWMA